MAALLQLVKLFSRKRRAEEDFKSPRESKTARKRFVRDMDFETEDSEPAVMSAIVITKSNRNERDEYEMRSRDRWMNGYQKWDDASFKKRLTHTTAAFFIMPSISFTLFVCWPSLHTLTNYASRRTIFRSASFN